MAGICLPTVPFGTPISNPVYRMEQQNIAKGHLHLIGLVGRRIAMGTGDAAEILSF